MTVIGIEAASNPSTPVVAETLGYTMWWGSEPALGVARPRVARGLGLAALMRPASEALRPRLPAHERSLPARVWLAGVALTSLAGLVGVIAVGDAVAANAKPDSHVYDYRPTRELAVGIERLIPPGQTIDYRFGPLDLGTQPIEPAIRFFLVRHGDRVLAKGSFPRLGSYYELYNRPAQWTVRVHGVRRQRHMTLAARIHFTDPWGPEVLSGWVMRTHATRHSTLVRRAQAARALARPVADSLPTTSVRRMPRRRS